MKKTIITAIVSLAAIFCYAQEKGQYDDTYFNICTVWQNWGFFSEQGGPVLINYHNMWGFTSYTMVIYTNEEYDPALSVTIGENLEDALKYLEGMSIACMLHVGTFFNAIATSSSEHPERQPVMVGDRWFSGVGRPEEEGHSIVFFPKDNNFRFGKYGVHRSTFKRLHRRLKMEGQRLELP